MTNLEVIGKIKTPLRFVCGTEDALVPSEMTQELHDKAEKCKFKEIEIVEEVKMHALWRKDK